MNIMDQFLIIFLGVFQHWLFGFNISNHSFFVLPLHNEQENCDYYLVPCLYTSKKDISNDVNYIQIQPKTSDIPSIAWITLMELV